MSEKKTGVVLVAWGEIPRELASTVKRLGGYQGVEIGYLADGSPDLREGIDRVIGSGAERVMLIPALAAGDGDRVLEALSDEIAAQQSLHPNIEFISVSPEVGAALTAQMLVQCLQSVERGDSAGGPVPLDLLPSGAKGSVHGLQGGHRFVSRLAALGFIPGALLQVAHNFYFGPLIVSIRDTRIALGRREARRVRVRPLHGEPVMRRTGHGRRRWRRSPGGHKRPRRGPRHGRWGRRNG